MVHMQWNELSKKTVGSIIALVVLFAGTILAAAVLLARREGGEDVARIVRDSVQAQRITGAGEGRKIVADKLLVTFHERASSDIRGVVADNVSAKAGGQAEGSAGTYLFSFSKGLTALELRGLIEKIEQDADVLGAEFIYVE